MSWNTYLEDRLNEFLTALERIADAQERNAAATERIADAAEKETK